MKKLTLDETWKLSLRMWRWIIAERQKNPGANVIPLKERWLWRQKGKYTPLCYCYFCDYAECNPEAGASCEAGMVGCPGKLVSKKFDCQRKAYHYQRRPEAFLREIEALNAKRLASKKSKRRTP